MAVGDTILGSDTEAASFILEVVRITQVSCDWWRAQCSPLIGPRSPQHPDYSPATTANDVSVLELAAQSADFLTARPNIKPACLPEDGAEFGGQLGTNIFICYHNLTL